MRTFLNFDRHYAGFKKFTLLNLRISCLKKGQDYYFETVVVKILKRYKVHHGSITPIEGGNSQGVPILAFDPRKRSSR